MVEAYVTDTHALVWYMTDDSRLSGEAKRLFKKADDQECQIIIPCIVLFESVYLIEKRKIAIEFEHFLSMLSLSRNYRIEPLCLPIIEEALNIPKAGVKDPWDRIIAATSKYLGTPLITRDRSLEKIGIETVW